MTEMIIKPDWQPIETAPKDGSIVRLAVQFVDHKSGELKNFYVDVYWGLMNDFEHAGEMWVDTRCPDNGCYSNSEFIRQITLSNQYYVDEKSYYYFGSRAIAWTRPWELKVEYPDVGTPEFTEKVYDWRKKRD